MNLLNFLFSLIILDKFSLIICISVAFSLKYSNNFLQCYFSLKTYNFAFSSSAILSTNDWLTDKIS